MKKVEEGKKKVISVKVASNGAYNVYYEGKKISRRDAERKVYEYCRACKATNNELSVVDYQLYVDIKIARSACYGDYSQVVLFDGEIENVMVGIDGQRGTEFVSAKKAENAENSVAIENNTNAPKVNTEPLKKLNYNERKAAKKIIEQAIKAGTLSGYKGDDMLGYLVIEMFERWEEDKDQIGGYVAGRFYNLGFKRGIENLPAFARGVQNNYFDYSGSEYIFSITTTLGLNSFHFNTNALDFLTIMVLKKIFEGHFKLDYCRIDSCRELAGSKYRATHAALAKKIIAELKAEEGNAACVGTIYATEIDNTPETVETSNADQVQEVITAEVETVDNSTDDAEEKAEENTDNKWEYSPNLFGNTGWQVWRHKFIYGGTVRITNAKDTDDFTVEFDEHYNNEISIRSLFSRLYVIEKLVPVFDELKIYNNVHSGIEKINKKYNGWFVAEKGKENDTFNVTFRKCASAEIAKKAAFEVAGYVISTLTAEFEKIDTAVLKHFETMNEKNEMALIPYVEEVEVEVQNEFEIVCSELKKLNEIKGKIGNEYDKTNDAEISKQLEEAYDYVVGIEADYLMKKVELEKAMKNAEECNIFDETAEEIIDSEFVECVSADGSTVTDKMIGLNVSKYGNAYFDDMQIGDNFFDKMIFYNVNGTESPNYIKNREGYLKERAARYESAENALKNGLPIRKIEITKEMIGLTFSDDKKNKGYYYCNFKALQIGEKFFPARRIYVGESDRNAQYEIDARESAAKTSIKKGLLITADIKPAEVFTADTVCNSEELKNFYVGSYNKFNGVKIGGTLKLVKRTKTQVTFRTVDGKEVKATVKAMSDSEFITLRGYTLGNVFETGNKTITLKPSDFVKIQSQIITTEESEKENKDDWEVVRDSAVVFDWTYYQKYPVEDYEPVEIKHAEDSKVYSVSCNNAEHFKYRIADFLYNDVKFSDVFVFDIRIDGVIKNLNGEKTFCGTHYYATFSKGTEEENKAAAFAYADYLVEFLSHFEKTSEGYILNQDYLREYIYGEKDNETTEKSDTASNTLKTPNKALEESANKNTPKTPEKHVEGYSGVNNAVVWQYQLTKIIPPDYDNASFLGADYVEQLRTKYDAMQKYLVEYKENLSTGGKYRVESLRYWYGYDNELKETVSRCTVQVEYTDDRARGWTGAETSIWLIAYFIKTDAVTGEIIDEWGCSKSHMLKDLFNHLPDAPTNEVDAVEVPQTIQFEVGKYYPRYIHGNDKSAFEIYKCIKRKENKKSTSVTFEFALYKDSDGGVNAVQGYDYLKHKIEIHPACKDDLLGIEYNAYEVLHYGKHWQINSYEVYDLKQGEVKRILPESFVRKKPNTAVKVNIRPAKTRGRLFTRKPLNENINALKTA